MLRQVKELKGFTVRASDGDIGRVKDFYFDDARWTIRYLVVDTSEDYAAGRQVLVSPIAFRDVEWLPRRFNLALTRERVQQSPSIESDKPVSRQYERDYFKYYDWPSYWGYGGIWGPGEFPAALAAGTWGEEVDERIDPPDGNRGDPHLRSTLEVTGYHIRGQDGVLGHVEDFVVDDENWVIRYLVVDTSNWWFGKNVLLAPSWIGSISWPEKEVHVNLPREVIKKSPEWHSQQPIDREYETRLHAHYGWPSYW